MTRIKTKAIVQTLHFGEPEFFGQTYSNTDFVEFKKSNIDSIRPFKCFNIHKDLTEYLRRLIANRYGIRKSFIYPHLYDDAKSIREAVLNSIAL